MVTPNESLLDIQKLLLNYQSLEKIQKILQNKRKL